LTRGGGYDNPRGLALYRELRERLASLPDVRAVAAANSGPFSGGNSGGAFYVEVTSDGKTKRRSFWQSASPGYFRTMGIPLLAGRDFSERDDAAAPRWPSSTMFFARYYFGNRNPLGRHLGHRSMKLDCEIVAWWPPANTRSARARRPLLLLPLRPGRADRAPDLLRAHEPRGQPGGLPDPPAGPGVGLELPVNNMKSMQVRIEESAIAERLIAMLAAAFGVLATLVRRSDCTA